VGHHYSLWSIAFKKCTSLSNALAMHVHGRQFQGGRCACRMIWQRGGTSANRPGGATRWPPRSAMAALAVMMRCCSVKNRRCLRREGLGAARSTQGKRTQFYNASGQQTGSGTTARDGRTERSGHWLVEQQEVIASSAAYGLRQPATTPLPVMVAVAVLNRFAGPSRCSKSSGHVVFPQLAYMRARRASSAS
jgi:hypothetical protein